MLLVFRVQTGVYKSGWKEKDETVSPASVFYTHGILYAGMCFRRCFVGLQELLSVHRNHLYVFPLQSRRYDSRTTIFSPEGEVEIV